MSTRRYRFTVVVSAVLVTGIAVIYLMIVGHIPGPGKQQAMTLFGFDPGVPVFGYSTGFEDHMTFLVFKSTREYVEAGVARNYLASAETGSRGECLDAFSEPWWFTLADDTPGLCWRREHSYGGATSVHYNESSGFVYVFDYST